MWPAFSLILTSTLQGEGWVHFSHEDTKVPDDLIQSQVSSRPSFPVTGLALEAIPARETEGVTGTAPG